MSASVQPSTALGTLIGRVLAGKLCRPIHHQDESEDQNIARMQYRLSDLARERQRLEEDRRFAAIEAAYYRTETNEAQKAQPLAGFNKALANVEEQYTEVYSNLINRLRTHPFLAVPEPAHNGESSLSTGYPENPNAYEKYWAARLLKLAANRGRPDNIVPDDLRVAVPELAFRRASITNVLSLLDFFGIELDLEAPDDRSLWVLLRKTRQIPEPTNDQAFEAFARVRALLSQLRKEVTETQECLAPTLRVVRGLRTAPNCTEELVQPKTSVDRNRELKSVIARLNRLGLKGLDTSVPKRFPLSRALAALARVNPLLQDQDIEAIARETLFSELIPSDNVLRIGAIIRQMDAARTAVLEMHIRVVLHTCTNYLGRGLPLLDLFQEGFQGLMNALDRFDPEQNTTFRAYASFWINQSITRAIAMQARLVRLPVYVLDRLAKLSATTDSISTDPEQPGAATLDGEANRLTAALSPATEEILLRLEEVSEAELQTVASVPDTSDVFEEGGESSLLKVKLEQVFGTLKSREKEVVILRFGLNGTPIQTLEQIGSIYNLTRERVRQIEVSALKKLRHPSRADLLKGYL